MEAKTITTAGSLQIGDRFYKQVDKKKKVFQMVEGDQKQTQYRTYKLFCCPADIMDNTYMTDALKRRQYAAILKDTAVVFLRSTVAVLLLFLSSCFTDEAGARKTLERNGFKVLEVGGYDYFTESKDTYQTRFKAVAVNGDTVNGTVTKGAWGKGSTIRLDD